MYVQLIHTTILKLSWIPSCCLAHACQIPHYRLETVLRSCLFGYAALFTPSLLWRHLKTANNSAKFETLQPFCLLFRTAIWNHFHQNAQHWKLMCYRTEKYTVCRQVRASFSPESWCDIGLENTLFAGKSVHLSARKVDSLWQWSN